MSLEFTLLQMLASSREQWQRLRAAIPGSGLEDKTKQVAKAIGGYYKEFPDAISVETDPFLTWVFTTKLKNITAEQKQLWQHIATEMKKTVDPALQEGMYNRLLEAGALSKMQDVLLKYDEGEDIDAMAELTQIMSDLKTHRNTSVTASVENANVLDLLDASENKIGLRFSQPVWHDFIRPLQKGDFIGVCARPDAGKTSVLTCESAAFAPQLDELYGPDSCIIWLCNEGVPRKIYLRHYCSIFRMNLTELAEFKRTVCKGSDTKFMDAYYELTRGENRFIVLNANNKTNIWAEDVIAHYNPAVVIYDMIDNFKFNGLTMHGGTRTDQVLESMYQWARNLAGDDSVGHVAFATSQISGDGEGIPYPPKSMLKDSKTGKQGTFDLQIMMGQSSDPRMQKHRFFGTPKNKLTVDGAPSNMQQVSIFDHSRGLFLPQGAASADVQDDSAEQVASVEAEQREASENEAGQAPSKEVKRTHSKPKSVVKPSATKSTKVAEIEELDV